ncbi:helix-turn-helix domain-containing protein [Streptomyces reniochalinae]|uniref:helix-turn-helix domain-containing protein n=1 Tax=Streptomyces reniochalinae TaxID=2250578 RepID=UPI0015F07F8E|nr:AraC family transcriptional regulator [Streptomyces reniochalinae]
MLDTGLLRRVAELAGESGWAKRFSTLDSLLAPRLLGGHAPPAPSPVELAWRELRRSGGRIAVRDLATATGYSHKHVIDRFRDEIGLAPKTVSRVLRFRAAVELLEGGANLADIAHGCGYTDQPHLSREFARYAGRAPSAFSRSRAPDGGGLRDD